jgi:hypothetical protein
MGAGTLLSEESIVSRMRRIRSVSGIKEYLLIQQAADCYEAGVMLPGVISGTTGQILCALNLQHRARPFPPGFGTVVSTLQQCGPGFLKYPGGSHTNLGCL